MLHYSYLKKGIHIGHAAWCIQFLQLLYQVVIDIFVIWDAYFYSFFCIFLPVFVIIYIETIH